MQPLYSLSITIIENSLRGPCLNVLHFFNQGKINLIRICNLSVYTQTLKKVMQSSLCAFTHKGPNHNKQGFDRGLKYYQMSYFFNVISFINFCK